MTDKKPQDDSDQQNTQDAETEEDTASGGAPD